MITYDVEIDLAPPVTSSARSAIEGHHRKQPYSGDFFLGSIQLESQHFVTTVGGVEVGVVAVKDRLLSLCTIEESARKYDRQILATVMDRTGATEAFVVSWDRHHVELFGNYANKINNQAYQFELLNVDDLRTPVPGLALSPAADADLEYLQGTGFQNDFPAAVGRGTVRIARLNGTEVGIAMVVPHALHHQRVDIGMYTDPAVRRAGIGSSILTLASQEVLAGGRIPVAGCWWRNGESRRTLEAAGLTCVGTIFRLGLDPDRFADDD